MGNYQRLSKVNQESIVQTLFKVESQLPEDPKNIVKSIQGTGLGFKGSGGKL